STSGSMNVVLEETNTMLDAVVVSGLATTVKRANLANAVDQISAKQLSEITQQSTLDGALYGKFTGAQITSNSGSPGGGIGIRLRGLTSINGPAQPLFIVDGVYVDNSSIPAGLNVVSAAAAGGSTAQFDQDNASNRIADIDPGDIETIEILKGASAAAIYGSRASSGVVIITTKRGKSNRAGEGANIDFSQSTGFQTILNRLGTREWDAQKVEDSFGPDEVANFEAASNAGTLHDYEDELYGNTGLLSDTRLAVSGGSERTTFYSSATYKNETGIVPNTGYERMSLRLNVNHKVSDMIDLSLNSNYVKSSADRGYFNNDNTSTTMGIAFVSTPSWAQLQPDAEGNYPDNPYSASNFLQTAALMTNNEKVDRIITGGNVSTKLLTTDAHSLKLILLGGLDQYSFRTNAIFPRELQFEKEGNGTNGASIQGNTNVNNYNLAAYLVHTYYAPSGKYSLRSQLGSTNENRNRNTIITTATELIGSQTNVDQAGAIDVYQFRSSEQVIGWFLQEELNLTDQIYLTAGIRADKSSNNGDANKYYYYPKAS
ncbi:MAG: TonB-dependent receptor plug domain-containing protein, partial [Chitinophagales bacterium]